MAILVFCGPNSTNKLVKESISFANIIATKVSLPTYALVVNDADPNHLADYGVHTILNATLSDQTDCSEPSVAAHIIAKAIENIDQPIQSIILAVAEPKPLGGWLSGMLQAPYVTNVLEVMSVAPYQFKKSIFSGKALETVQVPTQTHILSLVSNTIAIQEKKSVAINTIRLPIDTMPSDKKVLNRLPKNITISVSNAPIVISGGRGMKGPENWHLLETLAELLGGALACSRPVSDEGWRPREEHVGQTSKQIAPQLYLAAGISGAIQHVSGIINAKVKIVINTDPQAPFFKVADYGIVGDALDIIPKLTALLKSKMERA